MNVVVAGGTGFIGQKIVSSLIENDHKVLVLIRNLKKHKNTFPTIDDGLKGIKFIFAAKNSSNNNSKWIKI